MSCVSGLVVAGVTSRCKREPTFLGIMLKSWVWQKIFIELMTSDRKLKASREGSKSRNYGVQREFEMKELQYALCSLE